MRLYEEIFEYTSRADTLYRESNQANITNIKIDYMTAKTVYEVVMALSKRERKILYELVQEDIVLVSKRH